MIKENVKNLPKYIPGQSIDEVAHNLGLKEVIKLASNENPHGHSPLVSALLEKGEPNLWRYPETTYPQLVKRIEKSLGIHDTAVVLGNGSNEIIQLVCQAFVGPGDVTLVPRYSFQMYDICTRIAGGICVTVSSQSHSIDLDAIIQRIDPHTKLILLANPNNPTGEYIEPQRIEAFLSRIPKHVAVLIDEAYVEYTGVEGKDCAKHWLKKYNNLIITRTFSKVYGLAGLRIGYAMCAQEVASAINSIRQPFSLNSIAIVAAREAIADQTFVSKSVTENALLLEELKKILDAHHVKYLPSKTNFLTIDFGDRAIYIYESLLKKGIIVRPLVSYDMPTYLRVTIGTEREMGLFYLALERILNRADIGSVEIDCVAVR